MSVILRPYQTDIIDQIRAAIRAKNRRVLLQLVTGGGKSITAASIVLGALAKGNRALVVAHRTELIDQMVSTFARLGCTSVGVIRAGDRRRDSSQPIQVASIQTLARRTKPPADLVVVDEAHHAAAGTWTTHIFDAYPTQVILGLSATPVRTDGKPLGTHFQHMVLGPTYRQLFATGHLSEPTVYSTPVLPDMTTVRTSGGDFNREDLEEAVNKGVLIGSMIAEWQKRASTLRTIVFAVSVAHSYAIVDMFKSVGVRAAHLDGETPEEERRGIIARLGTGELQVVSNCGVLTEGTDIPSVKCIILARPTKSLSLFIQMCGRALRPWEGVAPLILDQGGNVDRLGGLPHMDREWSLTAKQKKSSGAPPVKACPACFAFVAAASVNCPHCGHVFVAAVSEPEDKAPVIVDLALRTLDGDDAKLAFFRSLHKSCRERGWRSGAAVHRYFARFNEDPPKHWVEALKSDYRTDGEWKERVAVKQREKRAKEESDAAA